MQSVLVDLQGNPRSPGFKIQLTSPLLAAQHMMNEFGVAATHAGSTASAFSCAPAMRASMVGRKFI